MANKANADGSRIHNNFYPSQQSLLGNPASSSDDQHMPYQTALGMRSGNVDFAPDNPFTARYESRTSLTPSMSASVSFLAPLLARPVWQALTPANCNRT